MVLEGSVAVTTERIVAGITPGDFEVVVLIVFLDLSNLLQKFIMLFICDIPISMYMLYFNKHLK